MHDHPSERAGASPLLAVAGFAMLLTPFLMANPWFGVKSDLWPWGLFRSSTDVLVKAAFALWTVIGLWAFITAFRSSRRGRAVPLMALSLVLLVWICTQHAGLTIEHYNFDEMLSFIILGGSALAVGHPSTRRIARIGLLFGGLGVLAYYALNSEAGSVSVMEQTVDEVRLAMAKGVDAVGPPADHQIELVTAPRIVLMIAASLGILVAIGLPGAFLGKLIFVLLLIALAGRIVAGPIVMQQTNVEDMVQQLVTVLVAGGLALWLVGSAVIADAMRADDFTQGVRS